MNQDLSLAQGVLLGAVQGITEFLPVSSSGHLVLARTLFDMPDVPLLFDVLLHVATLCVVCIHYRHLIGRLVRAAFRWLGRRRRAEDAADLRMVAVVLVATALTVLVALVLRIFGAGDSTPFSVSILMLVTAAILATSSIPRGNASCGELTWRQALVTGVAQGFGTLAGISRSGITITASLWSGMDRRSAGEYAFVLSVPAVAGALVLTLMESGNTAAAVSFGPVALGCLVSFFTGICSLRLLLWMVEKARLWYFSIYLVVVGLFGLTVLV